MPLRSKPAKSDITIEDVIGTPSKDSAKTESKTEEIKEVDKRNAQKKIPESRVSEAGNPRRNFIAGREMSSRSEVNRRNDNNTPFVPGLIHPSTSAQITTLNGTDRYMATPTQKVAGYLDIMHEGHGFLRPKFIPSEKDIYISQSQIKKFQLREGDDITGQARMPKENERFLGLLKVETVNGIQAEKSANRPQFDNLTPVYPNKQVKMETDKTPLSTRIIDLFSPIGFGQRGLVVSPPKAGKTTILKEIAHGVAANFPKVHIMAVLIGERPEEVTDISRSVKGEVIASNFDEAPNAQTKVAEVGLARAKRLLEQGIDVFILLDSITRLARAYNLSVDPSGRTLSGGFDPAALYPAKRFLGAARSCEEGGSLTIIGTALVETGSRMDDLIYEEFKGTGNMELHLSRNLQEQRVFPAIDIEKSGTRHEELLLPPDTLKKVVTLRHMLSLLGDGTEKTATLVERLTKSSSNKEFLENLQKG